MTIRESPRPPSDQPPAASGGARGWGGTATDRVLAAVDAIRRGGMAVVTDAVDRENEGDLVMAAEHVTPDKVAFFIEHTSGLICVPLEAERADALALPLMVATNTETMGTAFTVSVDARDGTTTGISAIDRARTIAALADPRTAPEDLNRPGHVFPLRAAPGGVRQRPGHTEAAVELARLAGRAPVGVICELVDASRLRMAAGRELEDFAAAHDLPLVAIADLVEHLSVCEGGTASPDPTSTGISRSDRRGEPVTIPTRWGSFDMALFASATGGGDHVVLTTGPTDGGEEVLVRVHSECLTGDVLGSLRCDCGEQLESSLDAIARAGRGVVIYLRGHEGRGIGLANKMRAYQLQDAGLDTVDANLALGLPVDGRGYAPAAQILERLGVASIRLMTNNPAKRDALVREGVVVAGTVPVPTTTNAHNLRYLRTKRDRMGHRLVDLDETLPPVATT